MHQGLWPEVVVHGERGKPNGMAQFTPYPQGFVQLHGMTKDITLFEDGLAASDHQSAQPCLPDAILDNIEHGWQWPDIWSRTEHAIAHFSQWVPAFNNAEVGGKPLCGSQQIPGDDPALRAAGVSFDGLRYARLEIVKASSAVHAAQKIVEHCEKQGWKQYRKDGRSHTYPKPAGSITSLLLRKQKPLQNITGIPKLWHNHTQQHQNDTKVQNNLLPGNTCASETIATVHRLIQRDICNTKSGHIPFVLLENKQH